MSKITANNTHARDDIADTCQIAIDIALVRKLIIRQSVSSQKETDDKVKKAMRGFVSQQKARRKNAK